VPREEAEWAVMEAVQDEILDPVVVSAAIRQALVQLTAGSPDSGNRLRALADRVQELDGQLARLNRGDRRWG
jgi:hypothetical protein